MLEAGCLIRLAGATARNRTADILITSEVLYRLSYGGWRRVIVIQGLHRDPQNILFNP